MNKPKISKYNFPQTLADLPIGPSIKSGNLVEKNSGWRTYRPIIDQEKCTFCLRCFLFCPEGAVDKSQENIAIDLDFCKGCGICAEECKINAIHMEKEVEDNG